MKNQFSKALIYSVIASSFILVNCQKSPNRGVKADKGGAVSGTTDKATGTATQAQLDAQAKVACLPEIATQLNKLVDINASMVAIMFDSNRKIKDKSAYSDDEISKLKSIGSSLSTEFNATKDLYDKAKIEQCLVPAKDSKEAGKVVNINELSKNSLNAAANIDAITGVKTALTQQNDKAVKAKADATLDGLSFAVISDDLVKSLTKSAEDSKEYISAGEVKGGLGEMKADQAAGKTVCYVKTPVDSLEKDSVINVTTATASKDSTTKYSIYEIAVTAGSSPLLIECSIDAKKAIGVEFKSAFGSMLKSKTASEIKADKDKAAVLKTDVSNAVDKVLADEAAAGATTDAAAVVPAAKADAAPAAAVVVDATAAVTPVAATAAATPAAADTTVATKEVKAAVPVAEGLEGAPVKKAIAADAAAAVTPVAVATPEVATAKAATIALKSKAELSAAANATWEKAIKDLKDLAAKQAAAGNKEQAAATLKEAAKTEAEYAKRASTVTAAATK